jgi:hypothetical protein
VRYLPLRRCPCGCLPLRRCLCGGGGGRRSREGVHSGGEGGGRRSREGVYSEGERFGDGGLRKTMGEGRPTMKGLEVGRIRSCCPSPCADALCGGGGGVGPVDEALHRPASKPRPAREVDSQVRGWRLRRDDERRLDPMPQEPNIAHDRPSRPKLLRLKRRTLRRFCAIASYPSTRPPTRGSNL